MNGKIWLPIFISALLLISCESGPETAALPAFITATIAATNPLPSASTEIAPSLTVEVITAQEPVAGVTTTQLNLRSQPSTAGETLGTVPAFSTVQIVGKESNGAWYQILDTTSPEEKGWIIASYVQVDDSALIPIIDLGPIGLITQGVNVRNGPGIDYASLGTLVAKDVVSLTGKDSSAAWQQIEFKDGAGWVASEFIQTDHLEILPVIAGQSNEIPTQQPAETHVTASHTLQDQDSLEVPIASVIFNSSGAGGLQSNGSVSPSTGDAADWIQFTAATVKVSVQLTCSTDGLQLDVYKNKSIVNEGFLKCNEIKTLNTSPGEPYTLKLQANAAALDPTQYSVLIKIVK